jgi:hypothetical protein
VRDRLNAEAALLDAVAERRIELEDRARLEAANQLIEILRECRHRHDELHAHLIGARTRLREALDDRFGRAPRSARRSDLAADLLGPYLTRATGDAAAVAARLVAAMGGLSVRWLPSLAVLTDELCAAARVPEQGEEFLAPVFDDDDVPEWWEAYEDTIEVVFDSIEEPVSLSQLLARVDQLAMGVADADGEPLDTGLLAAAVVHAAHRAWATRLAGRSAGDRVVLAVATGVEFDNGLVRSADLLLVPCVVTVDIDEPAVAARGTPRLSAGWADADDDEEAA